MRSSERMRASWPVATALLLVSLLSAGPGLAQQADPAAQALARAQALLRQVSAQKDELEVANARLAAELDEARQRAARAEAGLKEAGLDLESERRKAARSDESLDRTRERLGRTEDTLREAIERLRATETELRETLLVRDELTGQVATLQAELADSERKNLEMYQANVELMDLYRNKGPIKALLQAEPVTGLKSVAIENTLQEYRLKLDDALRDGNREAARGSVPGPSQGPAGESRNPN
jgi:chromosome segregation ATPase